MYQGQLVFAQLMRQVPLHTFRACVRRYAGRYPTLSFSHWDQFLCMAFAQLTYRESLRDIETCLRAQGAKLYHLGIRGGVARSTLADANERRDWRIYRDFAHSLIGTARALYENDPLEVQFAQAAYALDSTTIRLSLSLFPWAPYQGVKAAIRLHTALDLRGAIPSFVHISDGKFADVRVLDVLPIAPGSLFVMDRGYIDYARLYGIEQSRAYFVVRAQRDLQFRCTRSAQIDAQSGLRCDQRIVLTNPHSRKRYPEAMRRVKLYDAQQQRTLVFLTNHFALPAIDVTQLYRLRWRVELFFKWIKQHLRIKAFFGTSENAVKTQVWIAISVYVLVAIIKKRYRCDASLYTLLQIFSLTLFDTTPLDQLLAPSQPDVDPLVLDKQLNLFEEISGH
jgi:hypothetical protein